MAYKGTYKITIPEKYIGNTQCITWRSLWEKQTFKFIEENKNISAWYSEYPIKYKCMTDGKIHTYYVDLYLEFANGKKIMVEIKPYRQTIEPKKQQRKTKKYITEVMTYTKNVSKWAYAKSFCEKQGWQFQIWTENELRNLGIRIL